jgi:hypothetical protein
MLLGSDWNFGSNNKYLRYRLNLGLERESCFVGAWKSGCSLEVGPDPVHLSAWPSSFHWASLHCKLSADEGFENHRLIRRLLPRLWVNHSKRNSLQF